MKIVIDISNYDKEWITNDCCIPEEINMRISEAIANGTLLPENHGRLIDADELSEGLIKRWNTADNNAEKQISQVIANVVTPIVVSTPTIIPAEREEEE